MSIPYRLTPLKDNISSKPKTGYYAQLEKTISDENVEEAVLFVNGIGGLEVVMKIYSLAGADWYYHLVTPFAYG